MTLGGDDEAPIDGVPCGMTETFHGDIRPRQVSLVMVLRSCLPRPAPKRAPRSVLGQRLALEEKSTPAHESAMMVLQNVSTIAALSWPHLW